MKTAILALTVGVFLNLSTFEGQVWPIGSVAAIVIMGVWIKSSMDRHFEELKRRLKDQGEGQNDQKEEQ